MAATNSETRVTIVRSSELMFSWAPLSTSCSRILASRRRSNSAVVSERSMPCVSSMSAMVADAVCFDSSIAERVRGLCKSSSVRVIVVLAASADALRAFLQLAERSRHGRGRGLAGVVDEPRDLLAVLHHRLGEDEALGLDRLHGLVGDAADFAGEFLALAGKRAEQAVRLFVEQLRHLADALRHRRADLVGAAGDVARDLRAHAGERAFGFAGAAADRFARGGGASASGRRPPPICRSLRRRGRRFCRSSRSRVGAAVRSRCFGALRDISSGVVRRLADESLAAAALVAIVLLSALALRLSAAAASAAPRVSTSAAIWLVHDSVSLAVAALRVISAAALSVVFVMRRRRLSMVLPIASFAPLRCCKERRRRSPWSCRPIRSLRQRCAQ